MNESTSNNKDGKNYIIADFTAGEDQFEFDQNIITALSHTETELIIIKEKTNETKESVSLLTPNCDKLDYILAASSGALCGVVDIFLIGKPGETPIGDITDNWFGNRTKDFAKLCGWKNADDNTLLSAIKYLEQKFKIPYDQSVIHGAAKEVFDITPRNHHFKSLGHNPTLLGLFFSVLDQFGDKFGPISDFISNGELITLEETGDKFELRGHNVLSKFFCAFVNWFGHLISDMTGSSQSKGRGMGIPSPLWSWSNDIVAIKSKLRIPISDFDKSFNEMALQLFNEGYDARFQSAQMIPVFINEMIVRVLYATRRIIKYFTITPKEEFSFSQMWKMCEPFSNATIKRVLTVAHGSFCLVDFCDASIRAVVTGNGVLNISEFFLRLNIAGVGRFTISLYGEVKRSRKRIAENDTLLYYSREQLIVENYIEGLKHLSDMYDDCLLLTFVDDLKKSDLYLQAFEKTVHLAEKRKVPDEKVLKTKKDIDNYFNRGK